MHTTIIDLLCCEKEMGKVREVKGRMLSGRLALQRGEGGDGQKELARKLQWR